MNRDGGRVNLAVVAMVVTYCVHWLDVSLVGKMAPVIAGSFEVPLSDMTFVFIASRLGMAIGALLGGVVGDRFGRKLVLCVCIGLASLTTLVTPLASSFFQFSSLRACSGLLLGGAAPCALALVASIAPERWRSMAITVTLAGATVGSSLGSLMAYLLVGPEDWRTGFFICGVALSMALALAHACVPDAGTSVARPAQQTVRELFGVMRITTLVLCGGFLLSMGLNAVLASWMPSFFHALAGIPIQQFAGIAMFTTPAAIVGMLAVGWLSSRMSNRLLIALCFCSYGFALALTGTLRFGSTGFILTLAALSCAQAACHGLLNLLVVAYYPVAFRATALGSAVAAGRIGGVVAPALGTLALGLQAPIQTLFFMFAAVPLLVGVLLWNHDPVRDRL